MQITHLEYTRTVNLGNYESAKLAATCQVDADMAPAQAMQELRDWVENEVEQAADLALERRRDLESRQERERAERQSALASKEVPY